MGSLICSTTWSPKRIKTVTSTSIITKEKSQISLAMMGKFYIIVIYLLRQVNPEDQLFTDVKMEVRRLLGFMFMEMIQLLLQRNGDQNWWLGFVL